MANADRLCTTPIFIACPPNSIEEKGTQEELNFNLYPNPAHDVLNIEFTEPLKENSIVIQRDILGRKIFETPVMKGTSKVMIETHTKGVYLISLETVNGSTTKKLIVE